MGDDGGFRRRIRLGPGAEFDLVRSFFGDGDDLPAGVVVGPGDDCLIVEGGRLAVTCDMSVEDVHFRRTWLTAAEIGYRAVTAALSDLAAVAARPVAVLVAAALPRQDGVEEVARSVQRGARDATARVGAAVVGGDVTVSPGPLVLDVVALGEVSRPILRDGARAGDEVWVTGELGAAGGAVELLRAGREPPRTLRAAFARPVPRVDEALWLAERGVLHALVDLSDGLAGDAGHLAAASGTSIVLEAGRLPAAAGLDEVTDDPAAIRELVLGAGEDYELCFTAAPGALEDLLESFRSRFDVSLSRVGRVVEGQGVYLDRGDGEAEPLKGRGWDPFRPADAEDGEDR